MATIMTDNTSATSHACTSNNIDNISPSATLSLSKTDEKQLSAQESLFISHYIVDFNASKAAQQAGYSAKCAGQQGYRLLNRAHIQANIAREIERRKDDALLSEKEILRGILTVLDRCMQAKPVEGFVWNEETRKKEWGQRTEVCQSCGREATLWRFSESGALKSLELLGKHRAMWTDKHEITSNDRGDAIDRARQRLAKL